MSTLNCDQNRIAAAPPAWTRFIPEQEYHRAAADGSMISSGMLREFRVCPAQYRALVTGAAVRRDSDAFRFGRAVHKYILEGEAAFRASFLVGGPVNERTGRSFAPESKAFDRWAADNGVDRRSVLTDAEAEAMRRMADAARAHPEIARLLAAGWPERSARARLENLDCQIRLDWLRPDNAAVDLKTVEDIARFEPDARRFGYLHQFAFYRDVALAAGAGELDMIAVVLEKKPPHRAGVWNFSADVLEPYAVQNRQAVARLGRCRRDDAWPTGYEKPRNFPLAGIPPLWLN